MLIALDYDETYTEDPLMWDRFIRLAIASGHAVICVTMRHEGESADVCESIGRLCTVYCTGRRAKLEYMTEIGRIPDVWIDDSPMFITQGAAVSRFVRRS